MSEQFYRWGQEKAAAASEMRVYGNDHFADLLDKESREELDHAIDAEARGIPRVLPELVTDEQSAARQRESILAQVAESYRFNSTSPDVLSRTWRTLWQTWTSSRVPVTQCDWPEEEIKKPWFDIYGKKVNTMMVYVPPMVDLIDLGRIFRLSNFAFREGTPIIDVDPASGWKLVESTIDAPNGNATPDQNAYSLRRFNSMPNSFAVVSDQELRTYIIASRASKVFFGSFFDQGNEYGDYPTYSELGGSRELRMPGRDLTVVSAVTNRDGYVRIPGHLNPIQHSQVGFRHEGRRKA